MWYVRHKPCTNLASRLALYSNGLNRASLVPRHLEVPSGASKMISEPMVHSTQTMHLSCNDTNTIPKWTKMRFHMTHVTMEFHRVHPKRLLRLWYVRHKPCYYNASRLAISSNSLNQASTWALSPSGESKTISEPVVHSAQTVQLSCVKISTIPKHTESSIHLSLVTLEYNQVRPKRFITLWYVRRKPCTYLASRLALSPNELNQASTWATSPRSTIRYVQNDFWAYGTFGANLAPILRQD
jgi:Leucine-rich repeat (LRR) protein